MSLIFVVHYISSFPTSPYCNLLISGQNSCLQHLSVFRHFAEHGKWEMNSLNYHVLSTEQAFLASNLAIKGLEEKADNCFNRLARWELLWKLFHFFVLGSCYATHSRSRSIECRHLRPDSLTGCTNKAPQPGLGRDWPKECNTKN